jgi:hypothetical protein
MSIKPVLVPDHDAAALRGLMDSFAEATTGPSRHELAESRAAVAAAQENIGEGAPDVMRHKGDKTVKIVKKGGKPIGEIGIDSEASPGNGPYYVKLYDGSYDAAGFDTAEEALAELRYAIKSSMSEGSDNLAIGQQMARDGIEYDPAREGEIISQIGDYLKRSGMTPRQIRGYMIDNDFVSDQLSYLPRKSELAEFAPSDSGDGGGDDDGFDEDTLRKLAAQWFAGDEDPQVERLLAAAGWEIGQDEGYDDEPGVFVVMSGDDDGKSYISWPAEELRSSISEGVTEAGAENNPVVNAITRRIMLQRTDLLSKYGPEKIGQAVDEVADFVGDVEEIGSSDVSGWVRHVEQMLGNMSEGRDVPHNDPNLSKAYNLGYQAYRGLKNNPQLAQAAQDRIEADFPQYLKMWTRGYHDGERFDQEKNMSEASPTGVFKQGDKVKVHGKYNGTVVGQDGDTYYVQIDGHPGSQAVSAASLANPAAGVFKQGDKVKVHGKYNGTVVGQDGDTYYVQIDGHPGSQAVSAASLANPAATVAESIDPVEQLRADIRRFAR